MNITDNLFNANINDNSSIKYANANAHFAKGTVANAGILLAQKGDILEGYIKNILGNRVSVLLSDNSMLFATMNESVSLNIGERVRLCVEGNKGSELFVKALSGEAEAVNDAAIEKLLQANNLSINDKNCLIVKKLMDNNMPVDRQGIQRIMQYSYANPNAPIDDIVALAKAALPVNENTLAEYRAYKDNTYQLTNNIDSFAKSILELSLAPETVSEAIHGDVSIQAANAAENGSYSENITDFAKKVMDIIFDNDTVPDIASQVAEKGTELRTDADLNDMEREQLFELFRESGVDDELIKECSEFSKKSDIIKFVNTITDKASLKEITGSEVYRKFFMDAIKESMTLDAKQMDDPAQIDKLYKKISEKANKLIDIAGQTKGELSKNMSEQAAGLKQRIDFINNLNENYLYAQIPFHVNNSYNNSDLYIYTNKKRNTMSDGSITALLHLDMESLGATDVHVSLTGNTISTRFYVEDEYSAALIDEHIGQLEAAINKKGFKLVNETIKREGSAGKTSNEVVKNIFDAELEKSVKRYSFDARM